MEHAADGLSVPLVGPRVLVLLEPLPDIASLVRPPRQLQRRGEVGLGCCLSSVFFGRRGGSLIFVVNEGWLAADVGTGE